MIYSTVHIKLFFCFFKIHKSVIKPSFGFIMIGCQWYYITSPCCHISMHDLTLIAQTCMNITTHTYSIYLYSQLYMYTVYVLCSKTQILPSFSLEMSSNKRRLKLNTVTVSLGCSCRRSKLSDIFSFNPKRNQYTKTTPKQTNKRHSEVKSLKSVQGFGRIGGGSLAVEKDSDDPYFDFRQSMLQMILENQIYSREDLSELLNCFLQLNEPYYHGVIVGAFTQIWNGV